IEQTELKQTANRLRKKHWKTQLEHGIEFIPSNDFSFYDTTLDTAVLLNIIPSRYRKLGLSPLDTYFAMARGYQGKHGDVKALAMKKWFHTNYHYIVPELEDDTEICLCGTKAFDEYLEAKELGIETKPVILGAFTLLKLLKFSGSKTQEDVIDDFVVAYMDIVTKFHSIGAQWIQFDEPYLVRDLSKEDIALFHQLYSKILSVKHSVHVLLQTYFGDIRDCYQEVCSLPFDGVGLDLVEGVKSLELIQTYGFPADKILFAGVINGKNIWRNAYAKTCSLIETLQTYCNEIVLSTSCSLQHVPYTLEHENKLSQDYKKYFAFAEEKLRELQELKEILEENTYQTEQFLQNCQLFGQERSGINHAVQERVAAIQDNDFVRLPEFTAREQIQKEILNLPLFPTTTIGSFPQTSDVKLNRKAFKAGEISKEQYVQFNRNKIAECIKLQEDIGLDVLVHGEYERNDMVEYFGECLNGFLFTEKAWVQSYGTRCVKPPIIWGDISRETPMTVEWSVYAQSLTDRPMKGMLTGPVTILNWSFPREDISLKECAYQIAFAIRDEVLDLEANGIRVIQVDEAALREKLPLRKSEWEEAYLSWAIPAFRLVHSRVKAETQIHTHMCYSEFTDIISAIDDMDADVITFEASRSNLAILDALQENHFQTQVGPGVYDIHSERIPSVEEIKQVLDLMLEKLPKEKLWVNPDCGLKTRGTAETKPSLEHMVQAAKQLRKEYQF
ncbi:MAG: 5-methyltetrahydropteroyltriglutamate--homocysteine S-methyltransferase, partial [Oscillospiraceae bacterium]|nr:5-methyltetrahydropteroyltriglutamate--homocysteine S-methyltransferase [Oscillospiraceae bacterium]